MNFDGVKSRIVHIQKECLVLNKLSGESVQGGKNDIAEVLGNDFDGNFFPTHRLDVPVSGLTLFARTETSLAFLNSVFAERLIEKKYWAIIEKSPTALAIPHEGDLIHWIKTDKRHNKSTAYSEKIAGAKESHLFYRIIGIGSNYIFIEIELFSGRHHQIRAQFASLGLHIKGDLKYGARRSEKSGGIRLHAYYLSFPNPANTLENPAENIRVSALPPFQDRLWLDFAEIAKP
jgi:23S rRNA pseudouridine1911/1915/1917 synthase